MNYRETTHFENNISRNSSKYKSKLTIWFFTQNRQVLPLPLIARCGQLGGQFSKPQVPGKTTLHALSFDPRKFQFLAEFSCFPMSSKQAWCVRGYGISTVVYTCFVHGFLEGNSCQIRDMSKGRSRMLREIWKGYVGPKSKFFLWI